MIFLNYALIYNKRTVMYSNWTMFSKNISFGCVQHANFMLAKYTPHNS